MVLAVPRGVGDDEVEFVVLAMPDRTNKRGGVLAGFVADLIDRERIERGDVEFERLVRVAQRITLQRWERLDQRPKFGRKFALSDFADVGLVGCWLVGHRVLLPRWGSGVNRAGLGPNGSRRTFDARCRWSGLRDWPLTASRTPGHGMPDFQSQRLHATRQRPATPGSRRLGRFGSPEASRHRGSHFQAK